VRALGNPPTHPAVCRFSSVSLKRSQAPNARSATTLPSVRTILLIMTILGGLLAFVAAVWVAVLSTKDRWHEHSLNLASLKPNSIPVRMVGYGHDDDQTSDEKLLRELFPDIDR
jgi:hypothetical protein